MKKMELRINGKSYRLVCDADQSDHIRQLADEVDSRARKIADKAPAAAEAAVLMMTCLELADELYEARQESVQWRDRLIYRQGEAPERANSQPGYDNTLTETVEELSYNIDSLSRRLRERYSSKG